MEAILSISLTIWFEAWTKLDVLERLTAHNGEKSYVGLKEVGADIQKSQKRQRHERCLDQEDSFFRFEQLSYSAAQAMAQGGDWEAFCRSDDMLQAQCFYFLVGTMFATRGSWHRY